MLQQKEDSDIMTLFSTGSLLGSASSLGVYLLQSYAIYRLAVVRKLPTPIFAFIPFFQLFMLGQIGDSMKYMDRQINNLFGNIPFAYALPLLSIAGSILRYPLSGIMSLISSFGMLLIYYLVFSYYAGRYRILFTSICCLPLLVTALGILSILPVFGVFFALASGFLSIATIITPVLGPLLILYCLRGRR